TFGRVLTTYRSTERATAKRAFRELKISALRFGDAYESGESGEWNSASISGNGERTGAFVLEFRTRPDSGTVRIFHGTPNGTVREFGINEMLALSERDSGFPKITDFPTFYRNFRTHFL
ncbi:MAG: hypothetical protein QG650_692, partial [Patescibacteria group bacterium]|nr:hypothetical protein [Patescibacteria group bacterium]